MKIRTKIFLFLFANPFVVACLANILVFCFFSDLRFSPLLLLCIFISYIVSLPFVYNSLSSAMKYIQNFRLYSTFWKFFGFSVALVCLLEYLYFGLPVLGQVRYVDFGFPFLHHICVSTWMLPHIKYQNKFIRVALLILTAINPIIIVNRDILMLTLLSLLIVGLSRESISFVRAIVSGLIGLVVFSVIGYARSPFALSIVDLPFSFQHNLFTFWPTVYIFGSTFNMMNELPNYSWTLYSKYITTFPEYYKFVHHFQNELAVLFYPLLIILLFFLTKGIRPSSRGYLLLFLYVETLFGVIFSGKLFNSHTLFVFLLFYTEQFLYSFPHFSIDSK